MNLKRLAATLVAAATVGGAAVAGSTPALAASGDAGYVPVGVNYRYSPYVNVNNIAFTSKGATWIAFSCWTDTSSPGEAGAYRRWFRTVVGPPYWVAASVVQYQPRLPHC